MFDGNIERMDQTEMVLAAYGDELDLQDDLVRMCVDKPEAGEAGVVSVTKMMADSPTSPGVWRRVGNEVNSCWELYPLNVAESIFSAFCDGGTSVEWVDGTENVRKRKRDDADECNFTTFLSAASTHLVDFETMKEVELSTGMHIDVSIVQATIATVNYTPTDEPIETGVWWKADSGKWHCYAEKALFDIRKAWRRREHSVILKKIVTPRYPSGVKYIINLMEMEQLNPVSGRKRPIKIISNARMPPEDEVSSSGRGSNLTIVSLGMDLLRGSLQMLLSVRYIDATVYKMVLSSNAIVAIEPSRHLKNGDLHPLYRKFRLDYETMARRVPGCCGQLMRMRAHTQESDSEESQSSMCVGSAETTPVFRHVFYLAPAAEVDRILETGLQGHQHMMEDCFALSTDYYELHSKTWNEPTYRLLLFLVMVPPRAEGNGTGIVNAIPVARVDHQLPIAVMTLRTQKPTEPELSGATDSNPFDSAAHNDSCQQVFCSATAGRESVETITTADVSIQRSVILPSKSKADMFLLFKLYCPKRERLTYVGGSVVHIGGRPTEILEWLREIAVLAPDAEMRLYAEDSSKCIDLNSTYQESELEEGSSLVYNEVHTGHERSAYRCPDFPTFREHVCNRQTVHFRSVLTPTVDDFCLELSSQDTYSDVIESVAQRVGLEDDSARIMLYFNDCFLQQPKPLPMNRSSCSSLLGNAHKHSTSIFYFEILECHPPELDGSSSLTIAFHGDRGEKRSVHEVELPKRSTVRDAIESLRRTVKGLRNPADHAEMRIFEVRCNRISKIHPPNEKIGFVCGAEEGLCKTTLRAVEIPEEDRDVGPKDRLIHVRHFRCPPHSRKCDFFGEPFLMLVREHETLADVKERMKHRVQMPEEEFLQCNFAFLSSGRREYLDSDDVVASRMQQFSLGFYDPILHFLGLEHVDSGKPSKPVDDGLDSARRLRRLLRHVDGRIARKRASQLEITPKSSQSKPESTTPRAPQTAAANQNINVETGGALQNQSLQRPGESESELPTMPRMKVTSPAENVNGQDAARDDRLALALIEPSRNRGISKDCNPSEPMPLAVCRPPPSQPAPGPAKDTSRITVPDSEFHNFDSVRTEKDVIPGQVWAIYDNHDGMPRYYGLITKVCRSPFKVEFSWLEPLRKHRWWVEATALSITCGEYETSEATETERQIGVFSHVVLEKAAPVRGRIEIYPKKGEVWARFSNWDVHHMLGPMPIRSPDGAFDLSYEYRIVQMLKDYSPRTGVRAVTLEKTEGFKTIFHRQEGPDSIITIPPEELRKFSHRIPAETMDGHPISLLPAGSLELDPASLPVKLTVVDGPLATGELHSPGPRRG